MAPAPPRDRSDCRDRNFAARIFPILDIVFGTYQRSAPADEHLATGATDPGWPPRARSATACCPAALREDAT